MRIEFSEPSLPRSGALVLIIAGEQELGQTASTIDKRMNGTLSRAIKNGRFKGKLGDLIEIIEPIGIGAQRIILAGVGMGDDIDLLKLEDTGGKILSYISKKGDSNAAICVDPIKGLQLDLSTVAAHIAFGARLSSYRFDVYRTNKNSADLPSLKRIKMLVSNARGARSIFRSLNKIVDGMFFCRDLVSEPANVLYPKSFAARVKKLTNIGLKVEILNRARMEKLGMGALLGVAQGSANEPKLVVMQWNGGPIRQKPAAFVGKGVTFDTGVISIKPSSGMEDMKWDMGGAGVVAGLMATLAGRKAKVNAVGVIGLVENMPSGKAQRPGDVVKTMSGKTIEVINTDAEGRLVLADALWYTQRRFKPSAMVDLATLTGAIIISLGHQYAGLFANDNALSDELVAAGKVVGERLWRLPVDSSYDDDIRSDIADMHNVGNGRGAGSIAGAKLLEQFVNDCSWAHLDIAGVTWSKKVRPTIPKGATGFGVRLLDRWVADRYEQ